MRILAFLILVIVLALVAYIIISTWLQRRRAARLRALEARYPGYALPAAAEAAERDYRRGRINYVEYCEALDRAAAGNSLDGDVRKA